MFRQRKKMWRHKKKRRNRNQLIGHTFRREGLLKIITEGKVNGKTLQGHSNREGTLIKIIEDIGSRTYEEIKKMLPTDWNGKLQQTSPRTDDLGGELVQHHPHNQENQKNCLCNLSSHESKHLQLPYIGDSN